LVFLQIRVVGKPAGLVSAMLKLQPAGDRCDLRRKTLAERLSSFSFAWTVTVPRQGGSGSCAGDRRAWSIAARWG
jgi:hypothetical protein